MRHDLTTLELLLAVARTRSITRGAEQLHMALAAASKRIADLEARLGVRLFVRIARGVEQTDACRSLLRHVTVVHEALDAFDREAAEISGGVRGTVRLAISAEAIAHGIAAPLAAFAAQHPDVQVVLLELPGTETEVAVLSGDADLGVFLRPKGGARLETWSYATGQWAVLVPEHHPLAGRPAVRFQELLGCDLIGAERLSALADILDRAAAAGQSSLQPQVRTNSLGAIAGMVEAGLGLAVMMDVAAARAADIHRVCSVPLADGDSYELVLGALRMDRQPVALTKLVQALQLQLASKARPSKFSQGRPGVREPLAA
ncbi:MAG TPA: LysR family transcriptional regulator [Roseateles sp.]